VCRALSDADHRLPSPRLVLVMQRDCQTPPSEPNIALRHSVLIEFDIAFNAAPYALVSPAVKERQRNVQRATRNACTMLELKAGVFLLCSTL
jgi:hypothetical protein